MATGEAEAEPGPSGAGALSRQVSTAMATVWRKYATPKPEIESTVSGTRVACVLTGAVAAFNTAIATEGLDDDGHAVAPPTVATYRREAMYAIAKVTHQRVAAFVSKHDEGTDTATEVFILDGPPRVPAVFSSPARLDN